jgi:hypothetical protein
MGKVHQFSIYIFSQMENILIIVLSENPLIEDNIIFISFLGGFGVLLGKVGLSFCRKNEWGVDQLNSRKNYFTTFSLSNILNYLEPFVPFVPFVL